MCRPDDIEAIHSLVEERRGKVIDTAASSSMQVRLKCDVPLCEVVEDFNSELKTRTRGYGSFSFEQKDFRKSDIVLLRLTVMDEEVDAFQFLIHKSKAHELGKRVCEAFKENLGLHQFTVVVRAMVGKRCIAKVEK